MLQHIVIASILAMGFACSEGRKTSQEGASRVPPAAAPNDAKQAPSASDAGAKTDAIEGVEATELESDGAREARLRAEWERYEDVLVEHDAADLSGTEAEMLGHLLDAARAIDDLHLLQRDPRALEWRERLARDGTEIERKIFERYRWPWCDGDDPSKCGVIGESARSRPGAALWPGGMTDAEFESVGRQINGRELTSPFTVVSRDEKGRLVAVPFAASSIFNAKMAQVAGSLEAAAAVASERSLARFLASRAKSFRDKRAFPYDASDLDWLAVTGDWEVTVGPYETRRCPRGLKAFFEMVIARKDAALSAALARFEEDRPRIEEALVKLIGEEVVADRPMSRRQNVLAVDVWMASGEARLGEGARIAYELPIRDGSDGKGRKRVVSTNHARVFEKTDQAIAEALLDEAALARFDRSLATSSIVYAELARGFGVPPGTKVTNPRGKEATVMAHLGRLHSVVEEIRVAALRPWLLTAQRAIGHADDEEVARSHVFAVVRYVGTLRHPLEDAEVRAAAVFVGWCLNEGALRFDASRKRIAVEPEKLVAAIEALAQKAVLIELTGDYEGARELVASYLDQDEAGAPRLRGALADIREALAEGLSKGGTKEPSLRYSVNVDPTDGGRSVE